MRKNNRFLGVLSFFKQALNIQSFDFAEFIYRNDCFMMAGFFCREADHMVFNGNAYFRSAELNLVTLQKFVKVGNNAVVAAAVTARNRFFRFLYGNEMSFSRGKRAHKYFLIGHKRPKLALRAVNARISAAGIERIHRERCRSTALEFHIDHLVVEHVVIATVNAITVIRISEHLAYFLIAEIRVCRIHRL